MAPRAPQEAPKAASKTNFGAILVDFLLVFGLISVRILIDFLLICLLLCWFVGLWLCCFIGLLVVLLDVGLLLCWLVALLAPTSPKSFQLGGNFWEVAHLTLRITPTQIYAKAVRRRCATLA